ESGGWFRRLAGGAAASLVGCGRRGGEQGDFAPVVLRAGRLEAGEVGAQAGVLGIQRAFGGSYEIVGARLCNAAGAGLHSKIHRPFAIEGSEAARAEQPTVIRVYRSDRVVRPPQCGVFADTEIGGASQ